MKLILALMLVPLISFAQNDPSAEMQKRLATYKEKMAKINGEIKTIASDFCSRKVEIACKMKNGTTVTAEESYDAKEIAQFKATQEKLNACKEDEVCKVKTSRKDMQVAIKGFEDKCNKGDNKYCFNHKVFQKIDQLTALMEEEITWLSKDKKK